MRTVALIDVNTLPTKCNTDPTKPPRRPLLPKRTLWLVSAVGAVFHRTITLAVECGSSAARSGDSLDDCAQAVEQANASKPPSQTFLNIDDIPFPEPMLVNLCSTLSVTEGHIDGKNCLFTGGAL